MAQPPKNDVAEKVQEKVQEKVAAAAPLMNEDMRTFLTQLVTGIVLAMRQSDHQNRVLTLQEQTERELAAHRAREKCSVCGQLRMACGAIRKEEKDEAGNITYVEPNPKDHHTWMVVYTDRPENADFFQGAFINGVRYLSDHAGHTIPVPTESIGHIKRTIWVAEDQEAHLHRKRKGGKMLGSIGPDSSNVQRNDKNINIGWGN